jgi:formylglycine-generating enzyme required for sulfatase activity
MIQRHMDLRFDAGDRVADRYVIGEAIGRGGMGTVYRAHDSLVDETVALKFLLPKLLTDKGKRLFIQEAQVARRLRHDNIVAVHDVNFTSEGILYLSMEFAQGQSLRKFLRLHREERRLLNVRLAVHVVLQVLAALEYAHRTVIHRDIKPENIMMMPGEQVKVLDFGLAKAVHEQLAGKSALGEDDDGKRVIGTLAYAAPEQLEMRQADERADLYAVGLVMHELLTLRTPLDPPVTVLQARKDVSPSLLSVLDRALKPEKEHRWPSAREFRRALHDAYDASYRQTSRPDSNGSGKAADTTGMVYFEGGAFVMGNNEVRQEAPETEVTAEPFWMDRHPVTVAEYRNYMKATGAPEPKHWRDPLYNGDEQPVVGVSFQEALAYAQWCGKDLPTEMQWEFAARGRERRRYPWGNLPPSSTRANYSDFIGMPTMVSMHEDGRTPEGLLDMAGNVAEWTKDPYVPYSLLLSGKRDQVLECEPRRVIRGGSWSSGPESLTTTARAGIFPESRLPTVGFRCVAPAR